MNKNIIYIIFTFILVLVLIYSLANIEINEEKKYPNIDSVDTNETVELLSLTQKNSMKNYTFERINIELNFKSCSFDSRSKKILCINEELDHRDNCIVGYGYSYSYGGVPCKDSFSYSYSYGSSKRNDNNHLDSAIMQFDILQTKYEQYDLIWENFETFNFEEDAKIIPVVNQEKNQITLILDS